MTSAAAALRQYAAALDQAQQEVLRLHAPYEQARVRAAAPAAAADMRQSAAAEVRALAGRHERILAELADHGRRAAGEVAAAERLLPDPQSLHAVATALAPSSLLTEPVVLPTGTDPGKVAAWWASLDPAQRSWLKEHRYHQLRDLRGLPATDLDEVNRRRLADDLQTLSAEAQDMRLFGIPPGEPGWAHYQQVVEALANAEAINERLRRPGLLLLTYDPIGPGNSGRAAIAYGNPDTATHTAIVVPGTGNSTLTMGGPMDNGRYLSNAMNGMDPGQRNAVVVWMGYDAPDLIGDAASDSYGEQGQGYLRDDTAGYRAAHAQANAGAPGHTTDVAHSYGSYVTGLALHDGMAVDDAVFIGSPGVGVNHATDLGMSRDHVYAGRTSDDPIAVAGDRFTPHLSGNSPDETGFGATRIGVDGSHGHSEYYKRGSTSLTNLARIATGHGDQITPPSPPPPTFPADPDPGPNDAPNWPGP